MATATGTSARSHPLWSPPSVRPRGCAKFDGVAPRPPRRVHPGGPHRTFRDGVARRAAGHEAWSATRGDASTSNLSSDADTERVVFLGDDRAAFTAAIYAARAGLDPVVFETMEAVEEAGDGGEAFVSSLEKQKRVRDAMRAQATKSGAACHPRDDPVARVDVCEGPPFTVRTKRGVVLSARTLVVSEACASALSLSSANDAASEKTRSSVRGAFVARGSGFAAGVAAERWHGPVTSPSTLSSPIGTAFAETARKVRAAVADVSATPFERAGRLEEALPGDAPVRRAGKTASSASFDFDPRAVRHTGADAFRRLYAGECVPARDRGDVREHSHFAETDCSYAADATRAARDARIKTDGTKTTAGATTNTKTNTKIVFALVAFFGAEGCAPCARVRPMLASVVAEYDRDRVRLVEMDVEADAETADALGVAGTPTALFYRVGARGGGENGLFSHDKAGKDEADEPFAAERVAAVVGGRTKGAFRDALDEILGEGARVDGPRRRFGSQGSG